MFRPIVKTHNLEDHLIDLIEERKLDEETSVSVEQLALCTSRLGFGEHILTDYGDELTLTSPWEIYTRERAESALTIAKETLAFAEEIVSRTETKQKGESRGV